MTEQKLAVVGIQGSQDSTMGISDVTGTAKCLIDVINRFWKEGKLVRRGRKKVKMVNGLGGGYFH